jgi:hypothetical protein
LLRFLFVGVWMRRVISVVGIDHTYFGVFAGFGLLLHIHVEFAELIIVLLWLVGYDADETDERFEEDRAEDCGE